MTFDLAPADINAVCRSAAHAVEADGDQAPIHLALDSSLPALVTDAERLRLALVNVLANAQQAVRVMSPPTRPACHVLKSRRPAPSVDASRLRCATTVQAFWLRTSVACSIRTSRQSARGPASAWPSRRTSSRAWAAPSRRAAARVQHGDRGRPSAREAVMTRGTILIVEDKPNSVACWPRLSAKTDTTWSAPAARARASACSPPPFDVLIADNLMPELTDSSSSASSRRAHRRASGRRSS